MLNKFEVLCFSLQKFVDLHSQATVKPRKVAVPFAENLVVVVMIVKYCIPLCKANYAFNGDKIPTYKLPNLERERRNWILAIVAF